MKKYLLSLLVILAAVSCDKNELPTPKPLPDNGNQDTSTTELKPVSTKLVSKDMFFSTVAAGTRTSVCQGFDFDEGGERMYFSQVTGGYKNTIGWTRRVAFTQSSSTASSKMTLLYFSHGNNIRYEKKDGADYLWIGNYGSRDSEDKYTSPQILSRIKLAAGTTLRNTETTDNYWFNTQSLHASFDVENDQLAIYSIADNGMFKVYSLSQVLNAPVKDITLPYSLKYGGGTSKVAPDPEFVGNPIVRAHDCTTLEPLYSFRYDCARGKTRGWQTFCIHDNKAYFFLVSSPRTNGLPWDSVIDVIDFKGNDVKIGIKQPFSDDIAGLSTFGYTDAETSYMENEGIIIRDDILYLLYVAKNKEGFRRPLVFQLDLESLYN